jgi:uncharacterized protein YlxW (UPF0749 family)
MSLINDLLSGVVNDDYAEARALPRSRHQRRSRSTTLLTLGVMVMSLLITISAAQAQSPAPAVAAARAGLVSQIQARTAVVDQSQREVETLREQVGRAQRDILAATDDGDTVATSLARLESAAAVARVSGPGVRITLDDATGRDAAAPADPRPDTPIDQGMVLDRDLQQVVNGLWAAGAEAIAINDQRLTTVSAIRSAGEAILVDQHPLSPPYLVTAIGEPGGLATRFSNSPAGRSILFLHDNYRIGYDMNSVDEVTVPGASSEVLRFATDGRIPRPVAGRATPTSIATATNTSDNQR